MRVIWLCFVSWLRGWSSSRVLAASMWVTMRCLRPPPWCPVRGFGCVSPSAPRRLRHSPLAWTYDVVVRRWESRCGFPGLNSKGTCLTSGVTPYYMPCSSYVRKQPVHIKGWEVMRWEDGLLQQLVVAISLSPTRTLVVGGIIFIHTAVVVLSQKFFFLERKRGIYLYLNISTQRLPGKIRNYIMKAHKSRVLVRTS
jgi:hypothetical protein